MHVTLNNTETEQLYNELLAYFGLKGATNQCQALGKAWKDPYNHRQIEEFIRAWLRKKEEEATTGEAVLGGFIKFGSEWKARLTNILFEG